MKRKIYALNIEGKDDDGTESINSGKFKTLHFPMGLGLILAAVQQNRDDDITVLDNYIPGTSFEEIVKEVEKNTPDDILLSAFLGNYQYGFMKHAIRELKAASPSTNIIMGGPMASCIPELLIDKTPLDIVVYGEGEDTILDLLHHLDEKKDLATCPGLAYRHADGSIIKNKPRVRIKELDKYPIPAYDLFDTQPYVDYIKKSNRCWEISTSRGCYARCNYCRLTFGNKISFRPFEHVFEEIDHVVTKFGINRFNFVDDNFLNSPRQVLSFVEALKTAKHKIEFRFQGRADRLTRELGAALRDVGCFDVSMGIESGSQTILDNMGKKLDIQKATANIQDVLDEKLQIHATFIVGMPIESHETISDTLAFIKRSGLPYVAAGILTPFPDTGIYDLAKERGLITDDDAYCESLGRTYEIPYINLTEHSNEQLLQWRDQIDALSTSDSMTLDAGFNREKKDDLLNSIAI